MKMGKEIEKTLEMEQADDGEFQAKKNK